MEGVFMPNSSANELMAEDLHTYIMHHHLSDFVLLGHSMGGKTAMNFAAVYPKELRQLVIADIGAQALPFTSSGRPQGIE